MAKKQTLKCHECEEEFEFDPSSGEKVITSLNESFIPKTKQEKEVIAYLKCSNGHIKPYKVIKVY